MATIAGMEGGAPNENICPLGHCPFESTVRLLARDMWMGDGKDNPSVTARLYVLEQSLARIVKNSDRAFWMGVGTLVSALGALLMLILGHH